MSCPPCNHNCSQGRDCPARLVTHDYPKPEKNSLWSEIHIWLLAGSCLGVIAATIAFSAGWIVGSAR